MAPEPLTSPAIAWLQDPERLQAHIQETLQVRVDHPPLWEDGHGIHGNLSVVFFLLGMQVPDTGSAPAPCLILNKRSAKVPQPGDICCPGGGIAPRFDRLAAQLLRLPLTPLRQWRGYRLLKRQAPQSLPRLSLLLATAMREGLEEMRLNPLGVRFLGVLRPERLVMFRRIIYPMVGWVRRQQHFTPNGEVARIVRIPLSDLLNPQKYLGLRLYMGPGKAASKSREYQDFPAFRHQTAAGTEILWGATFRIAMTFLDHVFSFIPPAPGEGQIVEKRLEPDYLTGKG